ncbi:MAG: hypothetical protein JSR91_00425 [Proteobacteria bacterium]|nr:hypothetical protein [Pseudomonadota bacterium]
MSKRSRYILLWGALATANALFYVVTADNLREAAAFGLGIPLGFIVIFSLVCMAVNWAERGK